MDTSGAVGTFLLMTMVFGRCLSGQSEDAHFEPQVAFVCNLPAMHMTRTGWMSDESTGCLQDHESILQYCKKLYGQLKIRDVKESADMKTITNWCESERELCSPHSYTVKPYLCLEETENAPSLALYHEATLKPADRFGAATETTSHNPEEDAYLLFIRNVPQPDLTEHEYYTQARHSLRQRHRTKMAKVMEEWEKMNRTIEKARNSDKAKADELSRQITTRFQRIKSALIDEEKYETRQLSELHQQRSQVERNTLKRNSLEKYMNALSEEPANPSSIFKALKQYIGAEEKDRTHALTRFFHIRKHDPREAKTVETYVEEHLKVIDRRIRQALDMLSRVPKHKQTITRLITPHLNKYGTLEDDLRLIRDKGDDASAAVDEVSTPVHYSSSEATREDKTKKKKVPTATLR